MGHEQSRRDDIESLAYVLAFLIRGYVQFDNVDVCTDKDPLQAVAMGRHFGRFCGASG